LGQKPRMSLGNMKHDRTRFEKDWIACFMGENLAEWMKGTVGGRLHGSERNQTNRIRLAYFFKRPANRYVPRHSAAAIGRQFKRGKGRRYGKSHVY